MNILGIDYGTRKIGLAFADSDSKLSEPLPGIRFNNEQSVLQKLSEICRSKNIGKIVIGVSEGKTAAATRDFANKIIDNFGIPLVFQDESLSTHEAIEYSIKAGIKRYRRKKQEDSFAAAIMLQNYLDFNFVS